MKNKNILLKLQEKYHDGGYALVSPDTGRIFAFGQNLKKLYTNIDTRKIKDEDKIVMYVPPPRVKHVFQISLSIRLYRQS